MKKRVTKKALPKGRVVQVDEYLFQILCGASDYNRYMLDHLIERVVRLENLMKRKERH